MTGLPLYIVKISPYFSLHCCFKSMFDHMSKRAATLKSLIFSPIFPYIIVLKPSQLYRYVGQIFMIRLTLSIKTRVPYKTVFIEVILLLLM